MARGGAWWEERRRRDTKASGQRKTIDLSFVDGKGGQCVRGNLFYGLLDVSTRLSVPVMLALAMETRMSFQRWL